MRIESGGRTILFGRPITSGAGAMGLMQLMGDTYNEMRARNSLGADPYNARDNIMAGAAYLHELYTKYGYPRLFAAYNAGPGRLEEHLHSGHALPAETRTYVRLATDGAVSTSFGEEKSIAKKSAKTRVAAVYQPAS
jgi:soluble lytic murein transglycosylase-like protein